MDILIVFEENYYLRNFLGVYLSGDVQIRKADSYRQILEILDDCEMGKDQIFLYITPDQNFSDVISGLRFEANDMKHVELIECINRYRCSGYVDITELKLQIQKLF